MNHLVRSLVTIAIASVCLISDAYGQAPTAFDVAATSVHDARNASLADAQTVAKAKALELVSARKASSDESKSVAEAVQENAQSQTKTKPRPKTFTEALALDNSMKPRGESIADRRQAPDYDNRGKRPPTTLEVLAWFPRVLFFPVFLVTEYVVRAPLEVATEWFERRKVLAKIDNATSWDDDRGGILPRVVIQSGFSFAVGLTLFWDDMIFENNDWAVGADSDFDQNVNVDALTRVNLANDKAWVGVRYQLERRDDFVYFGTGRDTDRSTETRFLRNKHMGILEAKLDTLKNGFGGKTSFEISDNAFDCSREEGDICGPDGIATTIDDLLPIDTPESASGFRFGYQLARFKLATHWDSRKPRPAPGSGVRLDLFGRFGAGLGDASDVQFVRYGGEASVFWDIWKQRTLGLRVYTELSENLGDAPIPFAELITVGGLERMRGFYHARFHGESAFVATLDYRYPISAFFDSNIFLEVGNVFGENLEDFDVDFLRPALGLSLRTIGSRYQTFDITVAMGGDPFGEGIGVEFGKISIGTNVGF